MAGQRLIAVLFTLSDKKHVTLLDNRSRRNFRKLMKDWAGAEDFNRPNVGEAFEYLPLNHILQDIESTYKGFENTPATEKLARDVFRLIDQIKVQNDFILNDQNKSDNEDDDDDEVV